MELVVRHTDITYYKYHRGAGPCRLRADHADYADFSNLARPPKIKLGGFNPEGGGME